MAIKALVTEVTDGIQQFVRALPQNLGLRLVLLLDASAAGLSEKWNLVVSGKGLDKLNQNAAILALAQTLQRSLPRHLLGSIDHISLARTDDQFVDAITATYTVAPGSIREVHNVFFQGELVETGYLLLSQAE